MQQICSYTINNHQTDLYHFNLSIILEQNSTEWFFILKTSSTLTLNLYHIATRYKFTKTIEWTIWSKSSLFVFNKFVWEIFFTMYEEMFS